MYPVIWHSGAAYAVTIAAGWVGAAGAVAAGIAGGVPVLAVAGGVAVVFMALFTRSAVGKLRSGRPALTREGEMLVGDALRTPLPVAGTTYEIRPDHEGGWVVVLHNGGRALRLAPGGWRIEGERLTRQSVARVLGQLGLSAH